MILFSIFLFGIAVSLDESVAFTHSVNSRLATTTTTRESNLSSSRPKVLFRRFSQTSLDASPSRPQYLNIDYDNFYEKSAAYLTNVEDRPEQVQTFANWVTVFRVVLPSLGLATSAKLSYSTVALILAGLIDDSGVFEVVAQDASQFIQNILTTSGLVFALLLGQTYYFMVSETIR